MDIQCYAQRMLNPFRGILNTVEFESAEAVTTDGINWDLYVRNDELLADLDQQQVDPHRVQVSEIRYGRWSANEGITRGRLYDSEDFERLEMIGDMLLEQLHRVHGSAPFPLIDRYELWLLDWNREPLALLDSAIAEQDMDTALPLTWRAGNLCRKTFQAAQYNTPEVCLPEGCLAECVEECIQRLAGDRPAAQWFERLEDGSGQGFDGIALEPTYIGRRLKPSSFPRFTLATRSKNVTTQQLLEAYTRWLTPWLLLLPNLSPGTRSRLEQDARLQASEVARQYRLYPEVINPELIDIARVQARLVSDSHAFRQQDDVIHNYYREIGVNG